MHIYHYAPYEPSAFKRLMGRYATREAEVDRLLRGERFVDLYAVVRRALRASVERLLNQRPRAFLWLQSCGQTCGREHQLARR